MNVYCVRVTRAEGQHQAGKEQSDEAWRHSRGYGEGLSGRALSAKT